MWELASLQYMLCTMMLPRINTAAVLDGSTLENALLEPAVYFQLLEDIHMFLMSTTRQKLEAK